VLDAVASGAVSDSSSSSSSSSSNSSNSSSSSSNSNSNSKAGAAPLQAGEADEGAPAAVEPSAAEAAVIAAATAAKTLLQAIDAPRGPDGATALHLACAGGHAECATVLVGHGASIDRERASDGATALLLVLQGPPPAGAAAAAGCAEMWPCAEQDDAEEPLVAALLRAGADANGASEAQLTTPLCVAAASGRVAALSQLLRAGAHPSKPSGGVARGGGQGSGGGSGGNGDGGGERPSDDETAGAMQHAGGAQTTPLLVAAARGCAAGVRLLLDAGASPPGGACLLPPDSPNTAYTKVSSSLDMVSEPGAGLRGAGISPRSAGHGGIAPLFAAARGGFESIVAMLLSAAAPVDASGTVATPLYVAAQNGHLGVVEQLIAADAVLDRNRTDDGTTALWVAAQSGLSQVLAALIAAGANVDHVATAVGATPLFAAAQHGHVACVEQLLAAGADFDAPTSGGDAALDAALTVAVGLGLNTGSFTAMTPLAVARARGHTEVVSALQAAAERQREKRAKGAVGGHAEDVDDY